MFRHEIAVALAAAAALLASPLHAAPQERLVEKYERFAGSEQNSRELVEGLRNDSKIDLSKNGKTTSFTPATGKMGWGNVDHALALAKASLAEQGIRNPTPEQIKAALNGGTITTKSGQKVTLQGVLQMRASGMGWGQIAHKLGVKLGDLKRANKDEHKHQGDWKQAKPEGKHDRPDAKRERADWKHQGKPDFHPTKFERPQRPDKVERPEKPHRGR